MPTSQPNNAGQRPPWDGDLAGSQGAWHGGSAPRLGVALGHQAQQGLTHLATLSDWEAREAQFALQGLQLLSRGCHKAGSQSSSTQRR